MVRLCFIAINKFYILKLLLGIFREEGQRALEIHLKEKKAKEAEEKRRQEAKRRKEEEEFKKESAAIVEVTDEEADRLQKEIDDQRYINQQSCNFYTFKGINCNFVILYNSNAAAYLCIVFRSNFLLSAGSHTCKIIDEQIHFIVQSIRTFLVGDYEKKTRNNKPIIPVIGEIVVL